MTNKKIIISAILLLTILAIGISFFIMKERESKNKEEEKNRTEEKISKEIQEVTSVPSGETDTEDIVSEEEVIDTSNWKTYRNEEYGFEFKYPGDWSIDRLYYFEILPRDGAVVKGREGYITIEHYQNYLEMQQENQSRSYKTFMEYVHDSRYHNVYKIVLKNDDMIAYHVNVKNEILESEWEEILAQTDNGYCVISYGFNKEKESYKLEKNIINTIDFIK